jgi:hypothetical protein
MLNIVISGLFNKLFYLIYCIYKIFKVTLRHIIKFIGVKRQIIIDYIKIHPKAND